MLGDKVTSKGARPLSRAVKAWHSHPMSNVTNLNQFRKAKARSEKRAAGDANAAKFGRSKAQRQLEEAQAEKARAALDAHRREDDTAP
mgnify:CR=1 FL=1